MRYLFIAEKPSLMREVKSCYDNNKQIVQSKVGTIIFTALAGHVCEMAKPDEYDEWEGLKWGDIDYPMIPNTWKIQGKTDKKDLISKIKTALTSCDGIIVGTDSDVEGYGIYWMLEQFLRLGKRKTLRFVEHSLTEKEILNSLLSMTDYHTDPVHRAATNAYLVRSRADWLFGMNCTRVMTTKKNTLLKVGRVKSATLGIVYENSMAIENFVPEIYYQVEATYDSSPPFRAVLLDKDKKMAKFKEKPIIDYPLQGTILSKECKRINESAPKLFDLTTLQAEAGRLFHYSPAKTLEIAQSLYEKHKVISYPRTQCCYVSSEKAKEFPMMLKHMSAFDDLRNIANVVRSEDINRALKNKQVVNDAEVAKESHDALLPTSIKPNVNRLTTEEYNVCHLIYARLLAQFLPKAQFDMTTLIIKHGNGLFMAMGKTVVEQGWRTLFAPAKEALIPALKEGDTITAESILPIKKTTTPPKRLTQASLVYSMKNIANVIEDPTLKKTLADSQGIGTPATRAGIIKDLLDSGYMEEKKGGLYITDLGKYYIRSLNGIDIVSPVFAAKLDLEMKKVQYQEQNYDSAYLYVLQELKNICTKMLSLPQEPKAYTNKAYSRETSNIKCPICGGTLSSMKFTYNCPSCEFKIKKIIAGKSISEKMVNDLAKNKKTGTYMFTNKKGTKFKGYLTIGSNNEVQLKW